MRKLVAAVTLLGAIACGGSSPLNSQYHPEIVNVQDSFALQLTGVQNGSASLMYTWPNAGTSATINMSSAISAGTVTLHITDSAGTQVYSGSLSQNGTFTSTSGASGAWTIRVDFTNATGTINFRVQRV